MEQFGHYFEFFAGLNAYYIVADNYLTFVSKDLNNHTKDLTEALLTVEKVRVNNHNGLMTNAKAYANTIARDTYKSLSEKDINDTIKDISNRIQEISELGVITSRFNRFCLYAFLYCILMLLLIGFQFNFQNYQQRESFFVFNLLSVVSLVGVFKKNRIPPFTYMLLCFFITLLVGVLLYFISSKFSFLKCNYDFSIYNIWIGVVAPASHFVYYYFRTNLRTKNMSISINRDIRDLEFRNAAFAQEMTVTFKVVGQILGSDIKDQL